MVPDKAMKEADLKELIKEARSKILPVIQTISDEEFRSIVKSIAVVREDKQVVINEASFFDILHKNEITLEELRKIQDKHYEVDIIYELTRDLFEK